MDTSPLYQVISGVIVRFRVRVRVRVWGWVREMVRVGVMIEVRVGVIFFDGKIKNGKRHSVLIELDIEAGNLVSFSKHDW